MSVDFPSFLWRLASCSQYPALFSSSLFFPDCFALPIQVQHLSGGELQRVALVLSMCTAADVYLIDEPSAYLDSEQRVIASRVIKRFILHTKKTAFIVEHDFIMATYLADRVVVFVGEPSVECTATPYVMSLSPLPVKKESPSICFLCSCDSVESPCRSEILFSCGPLSVTSLPLSQAPALVDGHEPVPADP